MFFSHINNLRVWKYVKASPNFMDCTAPPRMVKDNKKTCFLSKETGLWTYTKDSGLFFNFLNLIFQRIFIAKRDFLIIQNQVIVPFLLTKEIDEVFYGRG